jgi:hypothetical protein
MFGMRAVALSIALLGQLAQPTAIPTPAEPTGYGPWRLGMPQEEVKAVSEFGPYSSVAATGGLETRNGRFAGQKTTISFVFGEHGLRIIQIWAYEGRDLDQAIEAFYRVYHHLETSLGSVEIPGLKMSEHADRDNFAAILRPRLAAVPKNRAYKVQIAPISRFSAINVFSSLMRQPQLDYYYVFLYYRNQ